MWRRGGYGHNFADRLGAYRELPAKHRGVPRIWIQAVSVGELHAIGPILEALKREGAEVFLTTTTSTGYRVAADHYVRHVFGIGYFPIDWWPFSYQAWRRIDPDMAILTEGERWPEHIWQARARGVPVLAINARLSDQSFGRMRLFRLGSGLMLRNITHILACSAEDQGRFRALGFPQERISTTGNIKLDVQIPALGERAAGNLRRALGLAPSHLVLLGASTWPGEEAALLIALSRARAAGIRCSLLIVPRHAERRTEIERLLRDTPWKYHFRSRGSALREVDVEIADTTGELRDFLQLADLVFVGKSLPPHTEGQTPVEAAALSKPILFGPGMTNFRNAAEDLVRRGAAVRVADAASLAEEVSELLRDPARRASLAGAATAWRNDNQGAVSRTLAVIRDELAKLK